MEHILERVYPETVMTIRIWYSNVLIWYIIIQVSDLIKHTSDLMVNTRPSTKYLQKKSYTKLQDGPESNLTGYLHNGGGWGSKLHLLPLATAISVPQGSNTYVTCSENHKKSDQRRGKTVSLLFSLIPLTRVP